MADIEERPQRSRSMLPTMYRKALQRAITHFLREDTSSNNSFMALSRTIDTSSRTLHHQQAISILMK